MHRSLVDPVTKNHPYHVPAVVFILSRNQFVENHASRSNPSRTSNMFVSSLLASVHGVRQKLPPNVDWLSHLEGSERLSD